MEHTHDDIRNVRLVLFGTGVAAVASVVLILLVLFAWYPQTVG